MYFLVKLKNGEGPFWRRLKWAATGLLQFHLPVGPLTRPFFRLLFNLHVMVREFGRWVVRFFWNEPLFRSQCASIGPGLMMEWLPYLAGKGRIVLGEGVYLSGKPSIVFTNRLQPTPYFTVGDHTFIGNNSCFHIAIGLTIGKHCLLAGGVKVYDYDGHSFKAVERRNHLPFPPENASPVRIGDDVWIGTGALILKGVTIGDRSIVAALAVVTNDVPPDVVVAGNPARIVKRLIDSTLSLVSEVGGQESGVRRQEPIPDS